MIRRGGFDQFPAAIVGYCGEPWNYDWNGGYELPRWDLYTRRVRWNHAQATQRAAEFCYELQRAEKTYVLFLLSIRTWRAFGLPRPTEQFGWYRSALWGPLIPLPVNVVPAHSEQMQLTAIAEGRLPRHEANVQT